MTKLKSSINKIHQINAQMNGMHSERFSLENKIKNMTDEHKQNLDEIKYTENREEISKSTTSFNSVFQFTFHQILILIVELESQLIKVRTMYNKLLDIEKEKEKLVKPALKKNHSKKVSRLGSSTSVAELLNEKGEGKKLGKINEKKVKSKQKKNAKGK